MELLKNFGYDDLNRLTTVDYLAVRTKAGQARILRNRRIEKKDRSIGIVN